MKKHNFSAGPSILPETVMKQASAAVQELDGIGLSLIEISHRSKEFIAIMDRAQKLALELTGLEGKGYQALFLQGGASMQFLMTTYNLMKVDGKAAYLDTGTWSSKAIKEAKLFGNVDVVASSKDKGFNYIPKNYTIASDTDYLHLTSNNTIFGTQLKEFPKTDGLLVCDMSSDIFSRKLDFSQFDLIYAMDQSNYYNILGLARNANDKQKVQLILNEVDSNANHEVPDPYYGGDYGFENVYQMLDEACDIIATKIEKL